MLNDKMSYGRNEEENRVKFRWEWIELNGKNYNIKYQL